MANANDLVNAGFFANAASLASQDPSPERVFMNATTLTVSRSLHSGRLLCFNNLAGTAVTLPAATGSGDIYTFTTTKVATSSTSTIKVANGSDTMGGMITVGNIADGTTTAFCTQATADTITSDHAAKGGAKIGGDWIMLVDIGANVWAVQGTACGTGAETDPFSATVA